MAVAKQEITDRYALYNGDAMEVLPTLPSGSVHFSIYSPPFATKDGGLYHYSSDERDLSNSRNYAEFFAHYEFMVAEVYRLTMPGRMTAVHCMPVPTGNTGRDGVIDFPGDIIRLHTRCRDEECDAAALEREHGLCGHGWFVLTAEYDVWKEPLEVRNRTLLKSLAHRTIVDDSSRCSNASADQLLVFRRAGRNPVPIAHPEGLMEYAGSRDIPAELLHYRGWKGKQTENRFSHWIWRQYASSFWDDIRLDRVVPYHQKEQGDEKHPHPLQLDVIDRSLVLYSNPGETVLTPCAGVGSEAYAAVLAGRRAVAVELKGGYYEQLVRNVRHAVRVGKAGDQIELPLSEPETTKETA